MVEKTVNQIQKEWRKYLKEMSEFTIENYKKFEIEIELKMEKVAVPS